MQICWGQKMLFNFSAHNLQLWKILIFIGACFSGGGRSLLQSGLRERLVGARGACQESGGAGRLGHSAERAQIPAGLPGSHRRNGKTRSARAPAKLHFWQRFFFLPKIAMQRLIWNIFVCDRCLRRICPWPCMWRTWTTTRPPSSALRTTSQSTNSRQQVRFIHIWGNYHIVPTTMQMKSTRLLQKLMQSQMFLQTLSHRFGISLKKRPLWIRNVVKLCMLFNFIFYVFQCT